ncbi:MAG: S8 family serine peptidase [Planctomycetota bacterium]
MCLATLLAVGALTLTQNLWAQTSHVRSGSTPGTQRWLVRLGGRSFSLSERLAAIRSEANQTRRVALIDQLERSARTDQDEFARFAQGLGFTVAERFWSVNACVVEIPPSRIGELRAHRHVLGLYPDEARYIGTFTAHVQPRSKTGPALQGGVTPNGTDADDHGVNAAHGYLGYGANAKVAVFDTGVDLDQTGTGTTPDPDVHHAFRDWSGLSRATNQLVEPAGVGIECNTTTPPVDPYCPNQLNHPDARHGTGVSGIAVGKEDPNPATNYFYRGHAPLAKLLSYAISWPDPGNNPTKNWPTYETTVIKAVQQLETYMLTNQVPVHVLNISYHGWADPDHPTQLALDQLEREYDVLVVVLAGNEGDASQSSHGLVNGLSVGNVHRFTTQAGRWPHRYTSRGPLFGDPDRYFPDVCASGASGPGASAVTSLLNTDPQIVMPLVDYLHPSCSRNTSPWGQYNYNAQGSSMSAPQVAGAAALYRSHATAASAQQARAALLLATIDPFLQASGYSTTDHTYNGRNSLGVGFVRDDLLARYALGFDGALAQSVTLTPQTATVDVTYTGLTGGEHFAVAIAWPRPIDDDNASSPWANVDLEVRSSGGAVLLARSDSLRNTYERLVFKATGTSALLRIVGTDLLGQSVTVAVAARGLSNDGPVESRRSVPGYVARIGQEATCSASVPDQRITRVLPSFYRNAYGSRAIANDFSLSNPIPTSIEAHKGFVLASSASSGSQLGMVFGQDVTDGAPYAIRALAFRTWNPLPSCTSTLTFTIHMAMDASNSPVPPSWPPAGTLVASNVQVPVQAAQWNARGQDTWTVIVPLDTPFTVLAGQALLVWISTPSIGSCPQFHVDGTKDPVGLPSDPVWASYASRSGAIAFDGEVPVMGVIEDGQLTRSPELFAYGFPVLDRHLLFQVRHAGSGNYAGVVLGASNPNSLVGGCRILTSADLGTIGPVMTASLGHANLLYQVPNTTALLHQHVFAQAVVQIGGALLYSNGLRLTVGGVLP